MNKEITIYELLGLIKDGQAPEAIRYKQLIYCKEFDGYYTSNDIKLKLSIMNDLNAKVEIIEDKKIEIDRLNNIINELEKYINKLNGQTKTAIAFNKGINDIYETKKYERDNYLFEMILDKLKELKDSD